MTPRLTAGRAAWDYGVPHDATLVADAAIREVIGNANHDEHAFEIARTGSRVVIENMAAAIVYDLVTSGVMAPVVPDFPPPLRSAGE